MMPSDKVVRITKTISIRGETWSPGCVGYPHPLPATNDAGEQIPRVTSRILFSRVDGLPDGALPLYDSAWLDDPPTQGKYELIDRL